MKILFLLLTLCLSLCACELEISGNGDLDGFWQLRQADTIDGGGSTDMRENKVYWAVQTDLLEARSSIIEVFFRFNHAGDSLLLSDPYKNNRDSSDIKITEASCLSPLGINSLNERFFIMELNGSSMVLRSDMLVLYFKKY